MSRTRHIYYSNKKGDFVMKSNGDIAYELFAEMEKEKKKKSGEQK